MLFAQCSQKSNNENSVSADSYYTCPMHPSVVSSSQGSCPVCNMSLILVKKNETSGKFKKGNFITIDENSQILAGIKIDTVRFGNIYNNNFLTGITVQDAENAETVSSRFDSRIEKLYVNNESEFIEKGSPLFSLYSEKIIAWQKELIDLVNNKSKNMYNEGMIEAAKRRLSDKGISNALIDEIIKTGNYKKYITFYAENSGYISNLDVRENMYVDEGQTLFTINYSNSVWVEAKLYENLKVEFGNSQNFNLITESNTGKIYKGKLVLKEPVVSDGERFSLLKIKIENADSKILQGMEVKVFSVSPENKVLIVPKAAIIYGNPNKAWKIAHKNTFEQVTLKTGIEDTQNAEILEGLNSGDVIVSNGSYLLNSEFLLKK